MPSRYLPKLRAGSFAYRRPASLLPTGSTDPLLLPEPIRSNVGSPLINRREDRDSEARLFAGSGADALRTAIAKACRAAGIPLFSPHDLRHRRVSLLHLQGVPWARIGEFVGQRNLSVTADRYTHVLVSEAEVDYGALLASALKTPDLQGPSSPVPPISTCGAMGEPAWLRRSGVLRRPPGRGWS